MSQMACLHSRGLVVRQLDMSYNFVLFPARLYTVKEMALIFHHHSYNFVDVNYAEYKGNRK